jgi:anthranilate synthase component II
MRVLVIDNYDSFTYNLVYLVRQLDLHKELLVVRNDKISVQQAAGFDKILLSPGPGIPEEAGVMKEVIASLSPTHDILGVCLGHQGIAEVFGASLYNMPAVLHGIAGKATLQKPDPLFAGLPTQFTIGQYHSWAVLPESIGSNLEVLATDGNGHIMAIKHREFQVRGVQFHPESIMTEYGPDLLQNWLRGGSAPSNGDNA